MTDKGNWYDDFYDEYDDKNDNKNFTTPTPTRNPDDDFSISFGDEKIPGGAYRIPKGAGGTKDSPCGEGKVWNHLKRVCYNPADLSDIGHPNYMGPGSQSANPELANSFYDSPASGPSKEDQEAIRRAKNDGYSFDVLETDEERERRYGKGFSWGNAQGGSYLGKAATAKDLEEDRRLGLTASYEDERAEARYRNQGYGEVMGRALERAIKGTWYQTWSGIGAMLDFEDYVNQDNEVGNWLSNWADAANKEMQLDNEIYTSNDKSWSSINWWMKNGSDLTASVAAFAIQGYLTGAVLGKGLNAVKSLSRLGKAYKAADKADDIAGLAASGTKGTGLTGKGIMTADRVVDGVNTAITANMMNQAESIMSAAPMYDEAYKEAIRRGHGEEYAKQVAAYAASTVISTNRANFVLNLTATNKLLKAGSITGGKKAAIATLNGAKTSKFGEYAKKGLEAGKEAVQEAAEEGINVMAEQAGKQAYEGILRKGDNEYNPELKELKNPGEEIGFLRGLGTGLGMGVTGLTSIYDGVFSGANLLTGKLGGIGYGGTNAWNDVNKDELTEAMVLGAIGGAGTEIATSGISRLGSTQGILGKIPGVGNVLAKTFGTKVQDKFETDSEAIDAFGNKLYKAGDKKFEIEDDIADKDIEYEEGTVLDRDVQVVDEMKPRKREESSAGSPSLDLDHLEGVTRQDREVEVNGKKTTIKDYARDENNRIIGVKYDEAGQLETDKEGNVIGLNGNKKEVKNFKKGTLINAEMLKEFKEKGIKLQKKGEVKLSRDANGFAIETKASAAERASGDANPNFIPQYVKAQKFKRNAKGSPIAVYKQTAKGTDMYESSNERERRADEEFKRRMEPVIDIIKKQNQLNQSTKFSNSVTAASVGLDLLMSGQLDTNNNAITKQRVAENLAALKFATEKTNFTEQEFQEEVANQLLRLTDDKLVDTYAEEKERLDKLDFDKQALMSFEEGNEDELIAILEDIMNLDPVKAKEQGYTENYKKDAEGLINRVKNLQAMYTEYVGKHGYTKGKSLYMNRAVYGDVADSVRSLGIDHSKLVSTTAEGIMNSVFDGNTLNKPKIETLLENIASLQAGKEIALEDAKTKVSLSEKDIAEILGESTEGKSDEKKTVVIKDVVKQIKDKFIDKNFRDSLDKIKEKDKAKSAQFSKVKEEINKADIEKDIAAKNARQKEADEIADEVEKIRGEAEAIKNEAINKINQANERLENKISDARAEIAKQFDEKINNSAKEYVATLDKNAMLTDFESFTSTITKPENLTFIKSEALKLAKNKIKKHRLIKRAQELNDSFDKMMDDTSYAKLINDEQRAKQLMLAKMMHIRDVLARAKESREFLEEYLRNNPEAIAEGSIQYKGVKFVEKTTELEGVTDEDGKPITITEFVEQDFVFTCNVVVDENDSSKYYLEPVSEEPILVYDSAKLEDYRNVIIPGKEKLFLATAENLNKANKILSSSWGSYRELDAEVKDLLAKINDQQVVATKETAIDEEKIKALKEELTAKERERGRVLDKIKLEQKKVYELLKDKKEYMYYNIESKEASKGTTYEGYNIVSPYYSEVFGLSNARDLRFSVDKIARTATSDGKGGITYTYGETTKESDFELANNQVALATAVFIGSNENPVGQFITIEKQASNYEQLSTSDKLTRREYAMENTKKKVEELVSVIQAAQEVEEDATDAASINKIVKAKDAASQLEQLGFDKAQEYIAENKLKKDQLVKEIVDSISSKYKNSDEYAIRYASPNMIGKDGIVNVAFPNDPAMYENISDNDTLFVIENLFTNKSIKSEYINNIRKAIIEAIHRGYYDADTAKSDEIKTALLDIFSNGKRLRTEAKNSDLKLVEAFQKLGVKIRVQDFNNFKAALVEKPKAKMRIELSPSRESAVEILKAKYAANDFEGAVAEIDKFYDVVNNIQVMTPEESVTHTAALRLDKMLQDRVQRATKVFEDLQASGSKDFKAYEEAYNQYTRLTAIYKALEDNSEAVINLVNDFTREELEELGFGESDLELLDKLKDPEVKVALFGNIDNDAVVDIINMQSGEIEDRKEKLNNLEMEIEEIGKSNISIIQSIEYNLEYIENAKKYIDSVPAKIKSLEEDLMSPKYKNDAKKIILKKLNNEKEKLEKAKSQIEKLEKSNLELEENIKKSENIISELNAIKNSYEEEVKYFQNKNTFYQDISNSLSKNKSLSKSIEEKRNSILSAIEDLNFEKELVGMLSEEADFQKIIARYIKNYIARDNNNDSKIIEEVTNYLDKEIKRAKGSSDLEKITQLNSFKDKLIESIKNKSLIDNFQIFVKNQGRSVSIKSYKNRIKNISDKEITTIRKKTTDSYQKLKAELSYLDSMVELSSEGYTNIGDATRIKTQIIMLEKAIATATDLGISTEGLQHQLDDLKLQLANYKPEVKVSSGEVTITAEDKARNIVLANQKLSELKENRRNLSLQVKGIMLEMIEGDTDKGRAFNAKMGLLERSVIEKQRVVEENNAAAQTLISLVNSFNTTLAGLGSMSLEQIQAAYKANNLDTIFKELANLEKANYAAIDGFYEAKRELIRLNKMLSLSSGVLKDEYADKIQEITIADFVPASARGVEAEAIELEEILEVVKNIDGIRATFAQNAISKLQSRNQNSLNLHLMQGFFNSQYLNAFKHLNVDYFNKMNSYNEAFKMLVGITYNKERNVTVEEVAELLKEVGIDKNANDFFTEAQDFSFKVAELYNLVANKIEEKIFEETKKLDDEAFKALENFIASKSAHLSLSDRLKFGEKDAYTEFGKLKFLTKLNFRRETFNKTQAQYEALRTNAANLATYQEERNKAITEGSRQSNIYATAMLYPELADATKKWSRRTNVYENTKSKYDKSYEDNQQIKKETEALFAEYGKVVTIRKGYLKDFAESIRKDAEAKFEEVGAFDFFKANGINNINELFVKMDDKAFADNLTGLIKNTPEEGVRASVERIIKTHADLKKLADLGDRTRKVMEVNEELETSIGKRYKAIPKFYDRKKEALVMAMDAEIRENLTNGEWAYTRYLLAKEKEGIIKQVEKTKAEAIEKLKAMPAMRAELKKLQELAASEKTKAEVLRDKKKAFETIDRSVLNAEDIEFLQKVFTESGLTFDASITTKTKAVEAFNKAINAQYEKYNAAKNKAKDQDKKVTTAIKEIEKERNADYWSDLLNKVNKAIELLETPDVNMTRRMNRAAQSSIDEIVKEREMYDSLRLPEAEATYVERDPKEQDELQQRVKHLFTSKEDLFTTTNYTVKSDNKRAMAWQIGLSKLSNKETHNLQMVHFGSNSPVIDIISNTVENGKTLKDIDSEFTKKGMPGNVYGVVTRKKGSDSEVEYAFLNDKKEISWYPESKLGSAQGQLLFENISGEGSEQRKGFNSFNKIYLTQFEKTGLTYEPAIIKDSSGGVVKNGIWKQRNVALDNAYLMTEEASKKYPNAYEIDRLEQYYYPVKPGGGEIKTSPLFVLALAESSYATRHKESFSEKDFDNYIEAIPLFENVIANSKNKESARNAIKSAILLHNYFLESVKNEISEFRNSILASKEPVYSEIENVKRGSLQHSKDLNNITDVISDTKNLNISLFGKSENDAKFYASFMGFPKIKVNDLQFAGYTKNLTNEDILVTVKLFDRLFNSKPNSSKQRSNSKSLNLYEFVSTDGEASQVHITGNDDDKFDGLIHRVVSVKNAKKSDTLDDKYDFKAYQLFAENGVLKYSIYNDTTKKYEIKTLSKSNLVEIAKAKNAKELEALVSKSKDIASFVKAMHKKRQNIISSPDSKNKYEHPVLNEEGDVVLKVYDNYKEFVLATNRIQLKAESRRKSPLFEDTNTDNAYIVMSRTLADTPTTNEEVEKRRAAIALQKRKDAVKEAAIELSEKSIAALKTTNVENINKLVEDLKMFLKSESKYLDSSNDTELKGYVASLNKRVTEIQDEAKKEAEKNKVPEKKSIPDVINTDTYQKLGRGVYRSYGDYTFVNEFYPDEISNNYFSYIGSYGNNVNTYSLITSDLFPSYLVENNNAESAKILELSNYLQNNAPDKPYEDFKSLFVQTLKKEYDEKYPKESQSIAEVDFENAKKLLPLLIAYSLQKTGKKINDDVSKNKELESAVIDNFIFLLNKTIPGKNKELTDSLKALFDSRGFDLAASLAATDENNEQVEDIQEALEDYYSRLPLKLEDMGVVQKAIDEGFVTAKEIAALQETYEIGLFGSKKEVKAINDLLEEIFYTTSFDYRTGYSTEEAMQEYKARKEAYDNYKKEKSKGVVASIINKKGLFFGVENKISYADITTKVENRFGKNSKISESYREFGKSKLFQNAVFNIKENKVADYTMRHFGGPKGGFEISSLDSKYDDLIARTFIHELIHYSFDEQSKKNNVNVVKLRKQLFDLSEKLINDPNIVDKLLEGGRKPHDVEILLRMFDPMGYSGAMNADFEKYRSSPTKENLQNYITNLKKNLEASKKQAEKGQNEEMLAYIFNYKDCAEFLNSIPYSGGKTFLGKILEFVTKYLKSLGVEVKKGSYLEQVLKASQVLEDVSKLEEIKDSVVEEKAPVVEEKVAESEDKTPEEGVKTRHSRPKSKVIGDNDAESEKSTSENINKKKNNISESKIYTSESKIYTESDNFEPRNYIVKSQQNEYIMKIGETEFVNSQLDDLVEGITKEFFEKIRSMRVINGDKSFSDVSYLNSPYKILEKNGMIKLFEDMLYNQLKLSETNGENLDYILDTKKYVEELEDEEDTDHDDYREAKKELQEFNRTLLIKFKAYTKRFGVRFNEEFDEYESFKDNMDYKDSYHTSSWDMSDVAVKMLLSTLPKSVIFTDKDGTSIATRENETGFDALIDGGKLFNMIADIAANTAVNQGESLLSVIKAQLKKEFDNAKANRAANQDLASAYYHLFGKNGYLNMDNMPSVLDAKGLEFLTLVTQFEQAFYKSQPKYSSNIITGEGQVKIVNKNEDFDKSFIYNKYRREAQTTVKNNVLDTAVLGKINRYIKSVEDRSSTREDDARKSFEILRELGINFGADDNIFEEAFAEVKKGTGDSSEGIFASDTKMLVTAIKHAIENGVKLYDNSKPEKLNKNFMEFFFEFRESNDTNVERFHRIIGNFVKTDLKFTKVSETRQFTTPDGETIFATNLPSQLTTVASSLNDSESFDVAKEENYQLTSAYAKNSYFVKNAYKSNGDKKQNVKIEMGYSLGITSGDTGQVMKELRAQDKLILDMYNVVYENNYPYLRAADRTSESTFSITENGVRKAIVLNTGFASDFTYDRVDMKYFLFHLQDEIMTINAASNSPIYSEIDRIGKNNSKLRFFDAILSPALKAKLLEAKTREAVEAVVKSNEKEILESLKKYTTKESERFLKFMVDYDVVKVNGSGDSATYSISTLNIVNQSKQSFLKQIQKYILKINASYIEQTKLFTGDPAYFKNADDIFKRFKMFNATKKVNIYNKQVIEKLNNSNYIVVNGERLTNSNYKNLIAAIAVAQNKGTVESIQDVISDHNISLNQEETAFLNTLPKQEELTIELGYGYAPSGVMHDESWRNDMSTIVLKDFEYDDDIVTAQNPKFKKYKKKDDKVDLFSVVKEGNNYYITLEGEKESETNPIGYAAKDFLKGFVEDGMTDAEEMTQKLRAYVSAYFGVNEADAESYCTLPTYKKILQQSGGWTDQLEVMYQKTMRGEDLTYAEYKALVKESNGEFKGAFTKLKTHGTGFLKGATVMNGGTATKYEFNKEDGWTPVFGYKHSLLPLIPSVIAKSPQLKRLNEFMLKNGVDLAQYESAVKYGGVKTNGSFLEFGNDLKDGKLAFENNFTVQYAPIKYFSVQVDMRPEFKGKVTAGSQVRKLILNNMFSYGVPIDFAYEGTRAEKNAAWNAMSEAEKKENSEFYRQHESYVAIQEAIYQKYYDEMIHDFGLEYVDAELRFTDMNAFVEMVVQSMEDRGKPMNEIASARNFLKEDMIEFISGSKSIQSILYSIVNNRVIREKRKGEGAPQAAATGWKKATDDRLKPYRYNHDKSRILPAECKLALPEDMIPYVEKLGGLDVFNQQISSLMTKLKGIEEDNSKEELTDDEKELESFITIMGFRIPNQGLSSTDILRVTEFLPTQMGSTIVVPHLMTGKAGSDFDIDKLSIYTPNYKIVDGKLKVIKKENDLAKRYDNYVYENFSSRDLSEESQDLKESKKYSKEELEKAKKEISEINNLFKELLSDENIKLVYTSIMDMELEDGSKIKDIKNQKEKLSYLLEVLKMEDTKSELSKNGINAEQLEIASKNIISAIESSELQVKKESLETIEKSLKESLAKDKEKYKQEQIESGAKVSFEEFQKWSEEKQNSIEALQNEMINVQKDIMMHKTKMRQLVSPISDAMFKDEKIGLVWDARFLSLDISVEITNKDKSTYISKDHRKDYFNEVAKLDKKAENYQEEKRKLYDKYREEFVKAYVYAMETNASPSLIFSPQTNLEKFQAFLSGKTGVGIAALQNTFNTLSQIVDLYLDSNKFNAALIFEHNKRHDGNPSLSGQSSIDGELISETISAFINAYVDVAKDPFVFDINAGTYTSGTMFNLLRMGVSPKTVIRFLNQPGVREYVRQMENGTSISYQNQNGAKKKSFEAYVEIAEKYKNRARQGKEAIVNFALNRLGEGSFITGKDKFTLDLSAAKTLGAAKNAKKKYFESQEQIDAFLYSALNTTKSKYDDLFSGKNITNEQLEEMMVNFDRETNDYKGGAEGDAEYYMKQLILAEMYMVYSWQAEAMRSVNRNYNYDTNGAGADIVANEDKIAPIVKDEEAVTEKLYGNATKLGTDTVIKIPKKAVMEFHGAVVLKSIMFNPKEFELLNENFRKTLEAIAEDNPGKFKNKDGKERMMNNLVADFGASLILSKGLFKFGKREINFNPEQTYKELFEGGKDSKYLSLIDNQPLSLPAYLRELSEMRAIREMVLVQHASEDDNTKTSIFRHTVEKTFNKHIEDNDAAAELRKKVVNMPISNLNVLKAFNYVISSSPVTANYMFANDKKQIQIGGDNYEINNITFNARNFEQNAIGDFTKEMNSIKALNPELYYDLLRFSINQSGTRTNRMGTIISLFDSSDINKLYKESVSRNDAKMSGLFNKFMYRIAAQDPNLFMTGKRTEQGIYYRPSSVLVYKKFEGDNKSRKKTVSLVKTIKGDKNQYSVTPVGYGNSFFGVSYAYGNVEQRENADDFFEKLSC